MDAISDTHGRYRIEILCAALLAVLCGTTLRLTGYEIGLPYLLVKYGGSTIWGMMVYFVVAAALAARRRTTVLVASAIAIAAELFRLYHTPLLDEFRLTLAGALLLGRIFSAWNIVAYLAGIAIATALDRRSCCR